MKKFLKCLTAFMVAFVFSLPVKAEDLDHKDDPVNNDYTVVQCNGSQKKLRLLSSSNPVIYHRFGIFYAPGQTASASIQFSTTVSNEATISIVPELIDYGYSISYTAGGEVGWSETNYTSSPLELVIIAYSDIYKVTTLTEISPGLCRVDYEANYSVYRGWGYDLQ